jgi:hypothetical protein
LHGSGVVLLSEKGNGRVRKWLNFPLVVTDLQEPPSERTQTEKIRDLKSLARQYARDLGSRDDVHISYLEDLEDRNSDNLRLAQMLAM